MLLKAALTIDKFIMDGVNQGVKAINWTTGWTRAQQAQVTYGVGSFYPAMSMFANGNYFYGIFLSALGLLCVDVANKAGDLERKELDAIADGVKYQRTDQPALAISQYIGLLYGGIYLDAASYQKTIEASNNAISMGQVFLAYSLGASILRADPQEPRKNCLARGWENLKAYSATPATEVN